MIPSFTDVEIKNEVLPSVNYKMFLKDDFIVGKCNELEAMVQVIYKILNTERYQYLIYSWNYGIELADLFGEPVYLVVPEIERRIIEALTADDRIISCTDFVFDTSKRSIVAVTFNANTIFGTAEIEKEVMF